MKSRPLARGIFDMCKEKKKKKGKKGKRLKRMLCNVVQILG